VYIDLTFLSVESLEVIAVMVGLGRAKCSLREGLDNSKYQLGSGQKFKVPMIVGSRVQGKRPLKSRMTT